MKNGTGQLTLILILMVALFLQIEGVMPNIFAGNDDPLVITGEKDGLEFNAVIENKVFSEKDKMKVKATIKNISTSPVHYYASSASYGIRGVLGLALNSSDGKSKFTDMFEMETAGIGSDAALDGELLPGKAINSEFTLLPYFIDKGEKKMAASGDYILKLCYNKGDEGTVETEFPLTIVKRFGKIYVKS
jgi:hypothetical protein